VKAQQNDKYVEIVLLCFWVMIKMFRILGPPENMSALYSLAIKERLDEVFLQH
jgi:hypothetical protein